MMINYSVKYVTNDTVMALFPARIITMTMLNRETLRIEIKHES